MKNNWLLISDKALDAIFRNGLKRSEIPFDQASWIKMKIKLNSIPFTQQMIRK